QGGGYANQGGQSYGNQGGYSNQGYGAAPAPTYAPPAPPAPPAFNKAPQAGEFAMLDDNEDELPF
ncbi:MAG: single-stranded DNA-binding protein, partial [Eubacteriales bacterium]